MSDSTPQNTRYLQAMRQLADEAQKATEGLPKPDLDQLLSGAPSTADSASSAKYHGKPVVRGRFRRKARVLLPVMAAAATLVFTGTLVLRSALNPELPAGPPPEHLRLIVEVIYESSDYVTGSILLASGGSFPADLGIAAPGSDSYLDGIWDSVIGDLGAN